MREEGDDGSERGVTFRIGKFIGQVTIESKYLHIVFLVNDGKLIFIRLQSSRISGLVMLY